LAYLSACKSKGDSSRTLENRRVRALAFLKHAGLKPLIPIPSIRFTPPKPESYTQPEVNALMSASTTDRDRLLWTAYLQSGFRMQEMMFLRFQDVLDHGLAIRAHDEFQPKTHEERVVHTPKSLIEALRQLHPIGGSDLVFPTERGTVNWHQLRTLKRTAKRAGIPEEKVWLHKWRATFATRLLRGGLDVREVSRQLGHQNLKTTLRYLAAMDDGTLSSKIETIWQ